MSNIIIPQINESLQRRLPSFEECSPSGFNPQTAIKCAMIAIADSQKLQACSQASIIKSITLAISFGIVPNDNVVQEGWLIPYGRVCQFLPSYRAFTRFAYQSGFVKAIYPDVIYSDENYQIIKGSEQKIIHHPNYNRTTPAKPILVYAVAQLTTGGIDFVVQDMNKISKIKECSLSAKSESSPWNKWQEEMMLKSPLKNLCKRIPTTRQLSRLIAIDNAVETGKPQSDIIDITPKPIETEAETEANNE